MVAHKMGLYLTFLIYKNYLDDSIGNCFYLYSFQILLPLFVLFT